ncbi:phage tail assembly protein T [Salmonella enterica]
MSLALRMGRTLSELQRSLSASEFQMWAEYDRFSPIGDIRGDLHAAQIVSAVYGSLGAKVSIPDALLKYGEDPHANGDPFAALEAALTAAAG